MVYTGVGRFNNRTYVEFLQSWNATRKMKTKIGPAEVHVSDKLSSNTYNKNEHIFVKESSFDPVLEHTLE